MKRTGVVDEDRQTGHLFDWELLRWLHRALEARTKRIPATPNLKNELKIISTLEDCGYPRRRGSIEAARKSLIKQGVISRNTSQDTFRKRIARFDFGPISTVFNPDAIPPGMVPEHVLDLLNKYQSMIENMGYLYSEINQKPQGPTLSDILAERRTAKRSKQI